MHMRSCNRAINDRHHDITVYMSAGNDREDEFLVFSSKCAGGNYMICNDRASSIPVNDSFARRVTTGNLINIGLGTTALKSATRPFV